MSDKRDIQDSLEQALTGIEIPPCPRILILMGDEMRKEEPGYPYLASLIKSDVLLSAGLIKTVNSAAMGGNRRIRSINDALLMLGLRAVSNTVAGLIFKNLFPPSPDLDRFWDASERTAELSGWIVQRLDIRNKVTSDDAYTFSLFRDCGIPILLKRFPHYKEALHAANDDAEHVFTDVEHGFLPTDHAVTGARMLRDWRMPTDFVLGIQNHHVPEFLVPDREPSRVAAQTLTAIAQLAEWLHQKTTYRNHTVEWAKLGDKCLAILGIDEGDANDMLDDARNLMMWLKSG
jgi:HD-like signal output (HDOD) protein